MWQNLYGGSRHINTLNHKLNLEKNGWSDWDVNPDCLDTKQLLYPLDLLDLTKRFLNVLFPLIFYSFGRWCLSQSFPIDQELMGVLPSSKLTRFFRLDKYSSIVEPIELPCFEPFLWGMRFKNGRGRWLEGTQLWEYPDMNNTVNRIQTVGFNKIQWGSLTWL